MPPAEIIFKKRFADEEGPFIHELEIPNSEARFAFALIERWGLVAAKSVGEDSAGRATMDLLSVPEMTTRAFDAAAAAYAEARARGLMVEMPSWERCIELSRAARERN